MKQKIEILLLTLTLIYVPIINSCSVKYNNLVSVPRSDSSPFNYRIKHLWTGMNNPISVPDSLLKIWTDNGIIDTSSFYQTNFYIKPLRNGKVNIYTLNKWTNNDKTVDTIKSISSFRAICYPNIITVINEKLLKDSLILKYEFVFERNLKTIEGSRYQLGALPLDIEVLKDSTNIGVISFFILPEEAKEILKQGNKIRIPSFALRDMKTDLLFGTKELEYTYK